MDFIYQGKVTVPASELENFMSAGATLQIRGLKTQQDMPTGTVPPVVSKQSDSTTTNFKPAQQNLKTQVQSEKPKGSTTGDQPSYTTKFVDQQPIGHENVESTFVNEGKG